LILIQFFIRLARTLAPAGPSKFVYRIP